MLYALSPCLKLIYPIDAVSANGDLTILTKQAGRGLNITCLSRDLGSEDVVHVMSLVISKYVVKTCSSFPLLLFSSFVNIVFAAVVGIVIIIIIVIVCFPDKMVTIVVTNIPKDFVIVLNNTSLHLHFFYIWFKFKTKSSHK